jgi:hypothetical protein
MTSLFYNKSSDFSNWEIDDNGHYYMFPAYYDRDIALDKNCLRTHRLFRDLISKLEIISYSTLFENVWEIRIPKRGNR